MLTSAVFLYGPFFKRFLAAPLVEQSHRLVSGRSASLGIAIRAGRDTDGERSVVGNHSLLQTSSPALLLSECCEGAAETVLGPGPFVLAET